MDSEQTIEEIGNWNKEKVLGTGGFGYVILWKNKESGETIALKQCRWGHDPMMTPKNRTRWKLEVDMMSRLSHPNVVKAIPVPPELDVPSTELPILAMEYCANGDLRKLLNKPENCCGLNEKNVRLIISNVSSAINYLHSIRIIHRDLKPENIVIQDVNGSVVYKLIDLGYAKELDQGSLCTSFVGTLQYLAPELFMSQKYSCTVDYWSLGLVTHEVITGSRPFLPDKSPAEWIPIIKQKTSTQIRAFLDADKNIVFSEEIGPFYFISKSFQEDIQKWLHVMLEWDPKKRGKTENSTTFDLLETILNQKIVLVFCVGSLKVFTISVNENMSLESFEHELEKKSNIPRAQLELLLPNGQTPNAVKDSMQFVSNSSEEESLVFLFEQDETTSFSTSRIPAEVEIMMRNPNAPMDYLQQKVVWSQVVYISQQEIILSSRLIKAFKANLMHLLTKTSYTHKCVSRMTAEMNKLLAKCSFIKNSLQQDIESYEKQAQNGGFISEQLHKDWKDTLENLNKSDIVRQKVINIEACSASINSHTLDLQRSPYAKSKIIFPLEETYQKILDVFLELKKRSRDLRRIPQNSKNIVRLLCQCLQESHTQTQDILCHIRKVKQVTSSIDNCLPQIVNLLDEISDWSAQVDLWQSKRQQKLWRVIGALNKKVHQAERSVSPLMLSSSPQAALNRKFSASRGIASHSPDSRLHLPSPPVLGVSMPVIIPPLLQNRLDSMAPSSLTNGDMTFGKLSPNPSCTSLTSLSSILEKHSEDSRRLKEENESLVESLQNMMEVLKSCQDPEISNSDDCDTLLTLKDNQKI